MGRILGNETDVRLCLDSAVDLVVWPVILSIIPLPESVEPHGYGLVFSSGCNCGTRVRPDAAVPKGFVQEYIDIRKRPRLLDLRCLVSYGLP